jgi:putative (di)nucleoside polyphosphate hydrolase
VARQEQDWFLCRFLGRTSDIDIATAHPEFDAWKWVDPSELPDLIVPFKRDLYRSLLEQFESSSSTAEERGGKQGR